MSRPRLLLLGLVFACGIIFLSGSAQRSHRIPKHLLQQRLETVQEVFEQKMDRFKANEGTLSELFAWSERWLDAQLALSANESGRREACKNHLNRTHQVELVLVSQVSAGRAQQADAAAAKYYRLEAEIRHHAEAAEPQAGKAEVRLLTDDK